MGCTCCPYGPMLAVPLMFAFIAMVMTWNFTLNCMMVESDITGNGLVRGFGPWTVQAVGAVQQTYVNGELYNTVYYTCYGYGMDGVGVDSYIKTARAFSTLSLVLGITISIMTCIPACCSFGDNTSMFVTLGVVSGFTGVTSFLTLIFLASNLFEDSGRYLSWSGIICCVAGVLWLLIGCCLCGMPTKLVNLDNEYPAAPVTAPAAQQPGMIPATTGMAPTEKTVTKTINPDGTTTVVTQTTTTNPDGSKTVTEETTVEPAPEQAN